jgi:hypothetical protein
MITQMRRVVAVAILGLFAGSAVSASEILLAGRRARLRDTPDVDRRTSLFRLLDQNVDLTDVNPTITGATVNIFSPVTGQSLTVELPKEHWQSTSGGTRFRYRNSNEPHLMARLVAGRLIQFRSYGIRAFILGQPQEDVVIRITVGMVVFCAEFGGTIVYDDGTRFVGVRSPRPEFCPTIRGTTSTTTSTTTTTETSTSTTTTETTTTTTETTTTTIPACGDGMCQPENDENAVTCYEDCGDCGDEICSGPEDVETCPVDCDVVCECFARGGCTCD